MSAWTRSCVQSDTNCLYSRLESPLVPVRLANAEPVGRSVTDGAELHPEGLNGKTILCIGLEQGRTPGSYCIRRD